MSFDSFLIIDGLEGESADHQYPKSIDIDSIGWDLHMNATTHCARGGGTGKVSIDCMSVTKFADRSSPNLIKACCTGRHFSKATVVLRKAGEKPLEYMRYELEGVIIARWSQGGKTSNDQVKETVYLNFANFRIVYAPQSPSGGALGKIETGFSIAENCSL